MKIASVLMATLVILGTSGCADLTTLALQDKFVKPASVTHQINAPSVERGVKAAVTASGKTGWSPKTISVETGYLLAEYQPDVVGRSSRNYAYTLEVRVPNKGRGEIHVTVTPPKGIMGGKAPEVMANEFLDAYVQALKG